MFLNFLIFLRSHGLKVSFSEWKTLMDALAINLAQNSLMGFYELCKCICVKKEEHLDLFDQCFAAYFHEQEIFTSLNDELLEWLNNPIDTLNLTEEEKKHFNQLDLEELKKKFEERLNEQKEKHDGGSKWIGTGGTSPFGHSGYHPSGIRVGGNSLNKSAVQIASERRFQNLRHDITIDVRQISLALKKLKKMSDDSNHEVIDIDNTIKKTANDGGEINIVMEKSKKNSVKLLLLMDVGGSMTAHTKISEQLFSAAFASKHFKHFKFYYFHNCPYETLYTDINLKKIVHTDQVLRELDPSWYVIFVGDAAMSPFELTHIGGSVDWFHHNEETGIAWLQKFQTHFLKSIWLNPENQTFWDIHSNFLIRQIFPMFPMTIDGIEDAMTYLRSK